MATAKRFAGLSGFSMSKSRNNDHSISHVQTVNQIIEAQQATWKAIMRLRGKDDINPDGVFVDPDAFKRVHPQKKAHAYLLSYHNTLANKTYWVKARDLWQENLTTDDGDEYTVTVPDTDIAEVEGEITLEKMPTTEEQISLEMLNHRWSMRHITVEQVTRDSYYGAQTERVRKRIWLPPRALNLAFEQLEEVRTKIKLGADVKAPAWRSEEPLSLTPEEWDEHRNVDS